MTPAPRGGTGGLKPLVPAMGKTTALNLAHRMAMSRDAGA